MALPYKSEKGSASTDLQILLHRWTRKERFCYIVGPGKNLQPPTTKSCTISAYDHYICRQADCSDNTWHIYMYNSATFGFNKIFSISFFFYQILLVHQINHVMTKSILCQQQMRRYVLVSVESNQRIFLFKLPGWYRYWSCCVHNTMTFASFWGWAEWSHNSEDKFCHDLAFVCTI